MRQAWCVVMFSLFTASAAHAQDEGGVLEGMGIPRSIFVAKLYGFIEARFEKAANSPVGPNGSGGVDFESNPHEFDVPEFHIMAQATILERFRVFTNIAAGGAGDPANDEGGVVRNAWVETPIYEPFFTLRVGKLYRRFGIYNEQLDAVPYFPGIEPPEYFDVDHLMLTRTTNLMLHGRIPFGDSSISYGLFSGNDEREEGQFPVGIDLRYELSTVFLMGASFYTTAGRAVPTRDIGDGSPNGGVINWMASDRFFAVGGFAQLSLSGLLLQAEYVRAQHDGIRDPAKVLLLLDAGLTPRQRDRFGLSGETPTEADVVTNIEYAVQTAYFRGAYEITLADEHAVLPWTLTPYVQVDWYKNPETIKNEDFGGDNEAGIADDGQFFKFTIGTILRPTSAIAFKLDGSGHLQRVGGQQTFYPELRISFAFYWELAL